MIKITAVGGYQNVGRNMTMVSYKDEAVIIDMGLDLERYISFTEDEDPYNLSSRQLINVGAIPNDDIIKDFKDTVLAIIPTHAHLDHLGAIPFLSNKYVNAKILCISFSSCVLERISIDDRRPIHNKIRVLSDNSRYELSKNIEIEFINITHSIPQAVVVAVHTPDGTVVYANDFKFDEFPQLGKTTNEKRLGELKNVKALIMDSLYAKKEGHTPSEQFAKEELTKIVSENIKEDNIIIATTFSSHISRLKTLVNLAKKFNRKPIFLGRSLSKYAIAAQDAGLARFEEDCEMVKYSSKVKKALRNMRKEGLEKYFIICSGHQAEPKATLTRMIKQELIQLDSNDVVIFSSIIIPNEENFRNREALDLEIKKMGAKLFSGVHASGHASQEDHKKLLRLVRPEKVIPAHADVEKTDFMIKLCEKWGYKTIKLAEGDKIEV